MITENASFAVLTRWGRQKTGGRKRQRAGADDKAEGLTIRKLTRGNPTMKAMFAAIADKSVDGQEVADGEEKV